MVATARTTEIEIDPESDLARRIGEAGGAPLVLTLGGVRYVLQPQEALTPATFRDDEETRVFLANLARRRAEYPPEPSEGYDPERVREALDRVAGSLTDEEADRWIEQIYRARWEGTRSFGRPDPR